MEEIVIVGAVRTPIGKFGGSLARTPASDLGAVHIRVGERLSDKNSYLLDCLEMHAAGELRKKIEEKKKP